MRIFPEARLFEGRHENANLGLDDLSQQYLWVVCPGLDFLGRTQVRDVCFSLEGLVGGYPGRTVFGRLTRNVVPLLSELTSSNLPP